MHKCPLEGKSQKIVFIISFLIPIHSLIFKKTEGKIKEGKKKETQKDVEIIFYCDLKIGKKYCRITSAF
jgi:hypothetical protein